MQKKDALREKLEVFIKKYYQNRLIKGLIYGVGLSLSYFFLVALAEYLGHFPSGTRLFLFVLLLAGLTGILGYYIIYPLTKLAGLGKRLSYDKAARIIGKHFPEVDDKITNTLQLQGVSEGELDLIRASVEQRISDLKPVPFQTAINFGENKKYWPVLVIPVLVFVIVGISGLWDDFSESGKRIAAYDKEFIPAAPFRFVIDEEDLVVEQGEDLTVNLSFAGNSLPKDATILLPSGESRMTRNPDGDFEYKFSNLQEPLKFQFNAAGYSSQVYQVDVIPVPQVNAFTLRVNPPQYTNIKPFETEAKLVQDIPEGSKVEWNLDVKQAKEAYLLLDTNRLIFNKIKDDLFVFDRQVFRDATYSVVTGNDLVEKTSIRENKLKVIRDQFPEIEVQFNRDTTHSEVLYYSGSISDDYGFSRLDLVIEEDGERQPQNLDLNRNSLSQQIGSVLVLDSLLGEKSKDVKIYLEVRDNDGVNGPKLKRSKVYSLKLPGTEERRKQLEEKYKNYFGSSEEVQEKQEEIEKSLEELQAELREKKNLGWKEKNKIKELLKKQQELLKKQRENEEKLKELQKEENKLMDKPEDLKEKEEQIDKINEDQKKLEDLMNEIDELMKKLDTEKLKEKLKEMQEMNRQNQQAEQRQEDLLKDLKFQKDILEQAQKLKELSEEMKKLSERSEEEKSDKKDEGDQENNNEENSELSQQEEIEKEFEEAMKKVEELKEQNKMFEKATEDEKLEEKKEGAQQEMQKASENLKQQKQQPANENQKKAGEKMGEMSESMQMAMMNMQAQSNQENMETLRQILENLETLSFSIEDLSERTRSVDKNDPMFKSLLTEQKRLQDGAKIIEDSLVALSKRVPQLEQVVFKELEDINTNLDKGIQHLEELENSRAASNQQYVMTSANNLALLLDETMQSMMQMQAQMMKGNQNCQKPGGGSPKPSMQNMRKMQDELGKKMEQMKKGQKQGKGKPGKGRNGKEIVEMLSRQEQIRQALEEMKNEEGQSGNKGNLDKAIEEMKKMEQDLLDGELNDNYKERLKEIDTRLLESEKAELEQKKDKKRESQTADELQQLYREELEKYLKEKEIERESIDRLPLNFRHYYKDQTSKYLNRL